MTLPSISVNDDAGSPIDLNALNAGHVTDDTFTRFRTRNNAGGCRPNHLPARRLDGDDTDVVVSPSMVVPGTPEALSGPGMLGDIVIAGSPRRMPLPSAAWTNTQFLTVHGLLHLLGYDHATEEEYARMFALQDELLDSLVQRDESLAGVDRHRADRRAADRR